MMWRVRVTAHRFSHGKSRQAERQTSKSMAAADDDDDDRASHRSRRKLRVIGQWAHDGRTLFSGRARCPLATHFCSRVK